MAAGLRSVTIRFTGDTKNLKRAADSAERQVGKMGSNITKAVAGWGSKLADGLSGAIDSLPPMGKLVAGVLGAGLAIGLAPVIGAAISSAVLLAVGGGALALGIKSAMDSPKVVAAFDPLKKKASAIFEEFGRPFEEPLVRAAKTFGRVLDDLRPAINRIGQTIAPVIDKLAPALGDFLRRMMPGIESAVAAAVPLFNTLAEKLPGIGAAISLFFEKISANGDDANLFFSDMIDLITNVFIGLGVAIGKLASWYSNVRNFVTSAGDRFVEFRARALNEFDRILAAAIKVFQWLNPPLAAALRQARGNLSKFRADANNELSKIRNKEIRITAWTNIGAVVANASAQIAALNRQANGAGKSGGKRASGGPVSAGRSYLVGERGPEILTMGSGQNGNITPNRELQGGGDTYEVHLHLAEEVTKVIRLNNRDLKRRTGMRGATA